MPATVGIGLKPQHVGDILDSHPAVGWFEVHPENYMTAGGPMPAGLAAIGAHYPLSFHAVGLSLATRDAARGGQPARLKALVDRFQPTLVSDHLAWCALGGVCVPDLLPVPYTREALDVVCDNVSRVQDLLGREILVENPSLYLKPAGAEMDEAAFLAALAQRSGCGILLDVNNLYVSAANVGLDPAAYLAALPRDAVGEIHLAGHKVEPRPGGTAILIDDHGSTVVDGVWSLYRQALRRFGRRPTLIEWDTDVPSLAMLVAEAEKARTILNDRGEAAGDDRAA